jgi:ATP diphosphatase
MNNLRRLRELIRELRDPDTGCLWNRAQNFKSIVPYVIEEAYEVSDVVENEDWSHLPRELGDLLYQVLYLSQLGEEEGRFTFDSVVGALELKILRRNPEITGAQISSEDNLNTSLRWSEIKLEEREEEGMYSMLDDIPNTLPSVLAAKKIQERVESIGFELHCVDVAMGKDKEGLIGLKSGSEKSSSDCLGSEDLGALMFALINIGLDQRIDLDSALRKVNKNVERRFRKIEEELELLGVTFQEISLAKLRKLWDDTKS